MLTALEVKTSYSILSSLNRIDKLTEKASELGYSSLCITDTNNMFGVYEFYLSCKRNNIKPIIGIEIENNNDKFILLASSERKYPADFFNPSNVSFIFLEFKILTETFANFKSGVTFTLVTLTIPVTLGFFKSKLI